MKTYFNDEIDMYEGSEWKFWGLAILLTLAVVILIGEWTGLIDLGIAALSCETGDMNGDGIKNITDLSILAEEIRTK